MGPAVEIVQGDLHDPASLVAGLRDVDVASLATASSPSLPEQEATFVDVAQAEALPRLVKLSATGVHLANSTTTPVFGWHAGSEAKIAKAGIPVTTIRPAPFTSLLLWDAPTIRTGKLYSILGQARLSLIDPEDVADLTVAALTDTTHVGQSWDVGGPEALTFDQVAATLTEALGHSVEHIGLDEEGLRARLRSSRMPDWLGDIWTTTNQLARQHAFTVDDDVVRRVLGRPGRSLRSWIDRNRAAFQHGS